MSTNERRIFSTLGGCTALNLVNTLPMGADGLDECLPDFAALAAWCVQMNLISGHAARKLLSHSGAARALREVRALREHLRTALSAPRASRSTWAPLRTLLNESLAKRPCVQVLRDTPEGLVLLIERECTTPGDVVGIISEQIAAFVASPERDLARPCEGNGCVLWFVDRTRNHSRHWCRMETCGARAKARAYYQRSKIRP